MAVGAARGQRPFDFIVGDDSALRRIDQKHPAGSQTALRLDSLGRNVEYAGLGSHHHESVLGDPIAAGAQPVAIQYGADLGAVGKGDRRRPVPRLEQARLIFVIGLQLVGHAFVFLPGLGNEHRHRLGQRAAREHQQLKRVVEDRRIAGAGEAHRADLLEVVAELLAGEHALAGVHPVDVAAKGVDFAVVCKVAVRMRQVPRWKSIRAVALMH